MNDHDRILRWIDTVLREMSKLEKDSGIEMLDACGSACAKASPLLAGAEKVRDEYRDAAGDPDGLFQAFRTRYADASHLTKEGDRIVLIFEKCTCPLAREGVRNPYLCRCTVGFTKKLFETLFARGVRVDLEQSILRGDPACRQVITVGG